MNNDDQAIDPLDGVKLVPKPSKEQLNESGSTTKGTPVSFPETLWSAFLFCLKKKKNNETT